jgi:hypothetical protein
MANQDGPSGNTKVVLAVVAGLVVLITVVKVSMDAAVPLPSLDADAPIPRIEEVRQPSTTQRPAHRPVDQARPLRPGELLSG